MKAADTKPRFATHKTAALTLTEVLIVVAALALFAALFLPALAASKRKSSKIGCVNDLRQVGISYRMWADDHYDKFPMQVSITNDGAMELLVTGNAAACFSVMSNILDNPAILICPSDANHYAASNFSTLRNSNISYFVGLHASSNSPQTWLSGDENLVVNGKRIQSGVLNLQNSDTLAWTKERHKGGGNILLGDGSVQQTTSDDLTSMARLTTNSLAIP